MTESKTANPTNLGFKHKQYQTMKNVMRKKHSFRTTTKLLFLLAFSIATSNLQAQAIWDNTSFVHRQNQQILNGQNNAITLDGVNIGSWLLWEGLMWSGGMLSEKDISHKMDSVIGHVAFNAFRDSVYKNYITRADLKKISEQCFNVVRIPFNHTIMEDDSNPYVYKPGGWKILDSVLKWCEDYNVYAVLDLHSAPGGQSTLFTNDPDSVNLWQSASNKNRTIQLWKAIANRYQNRGIIAAYDLLNEPNNWWWPDIVSLYDAIIDTIRTVDSNHMIMLEGNNYATDFTPFSSLPDSNVCFQFHYYTLFGTPNMNSLVSVGNSLNAPVWCGEWGEANLAGLHNQLDTIKRPAYKVRGTAFWTWKTVPNGFSNPHCLYATNHPDWNNTMLWATYGSPIVTALQMQNGINNFIINMKLQNCTPDTGVFNLLYMCSPAGIQNSEETNILSVYPNPFTTSISVMGNEEKEYYELINSTGQIIWAGKQINKQDFSSIKSGLYFLLINNDNLTHTIKLIKN